MEGNIAEIYRAYRINNTANSHGNQTREQKTVLKNPQDRTHHNASGIKMQGNLDKDTTNFTTKFIDEVNKHDKAAISKEELFKMAASPIAPIRRVLGVKDSSERNKRVKTAGLALLALNNLPMDFSDINSVLKQIKNKKIAPNPTQMEFTFAQDTLLEFPLRQLRKKFDTQKFDTVYDKIDKSLFNTKIGQKIVNAMNLTVTREIKPGESMDIIKNGLKQNKVYIIKGKSKIAKLICRSMMRIPVLSVAAFALLEIPDIVSAVKNEEQKDKKIQAAGKQLLKSGINIASMVAGMAAVGAVLDRRFGAIGSLIGIGIGNYFGEKAGTFVNNKLFENKNNK